MERTLLDNDVVLKLGQYDLFGELLVVTGGPERIRILPTFRYRFRLATPEKAMKLVRDPAAMDRINAFVGQVRELEDEPPQELVALLQDIPMIDPGEVVLFAAAAADVKSVIASGDKRAICAVKEVSTVDRLRGRIKCLEQLVAEMLRSSAEPMSIVEKIRGRDWNTALRVCCSSRSLPDALAGLRSYYTQLNADCGALLAPFPEAG